MRLTRRVAIGVAVLCGGMAALLSVFYLRGLQTGPEKPAAPTTKEVVVPRVDIPPQTIITEDMLTVATVKVEEAPQLPVTAPASIAGFVAVEGLTAQKPISRSQVMPRGTAFGLAGLVPAGMRAVTVEVDPVVGVAGLLKAGDRVDVIASFEVNDELMATTILQDVQLLALGSQTVAATSSRQKRAAAGKAASGGGGEEGGAGGGGEEASDEGDAGDRSRAQAYPNATFAVTPEDAQKLVMADKRGELRLALRPVGEHDFVPVATQDMAAVGGPQYAALQAKGEAPKEEEKPKEQEQATPQPQPQPMMAPAPMGPYPAPAPHKETKKPEVEIIRGDRTSKVVP